MGKPNKQRDFLVDCFYTFGKETQIITDDYEVRGTVVDTSNTDWEAAFLQQCHTPLELLSYLREYLVADLKTVRKGSKKEKFLIRLLSDCEGWRFVDSSFEEEECGARVVMMDI